MLLHTVADQQLVAGTAGKLSWQPVDSDGEPVNPGVVTVAVVRSDGSTVFSAGTPTDGTGAAARSVAVSPAHTASVDILSATWSVSGTVVASTVHEVIGSALLSRAEFVAREATMGTVESAPFVRARREVDDLFKRETRRGLTPRFAVERFDVGRASCRLVLRYPDVRAVRWARHVTSSGATAIDVSGVGPSAPGFADLADGWPVGMVEVGYEHGYDRAPFDIVGAAARYLRSTAGKPTSGVPDRATSYSDGQGGVTQLATPGLGPFITGIPEVDEVLVAHRWNPPRVA